MVTHVVNKEARALNGVKTSRQTVTDIPCNLADKFVETAIMNGMTKREAAMLGMVLFLKKAKIKPPAFPEKAYLYARLNRMKETGKK